MTDLANLKALCVAASRPMPRKRRAGWWRDQGAFQDAANPAAILDLIERVERAEGQRDEAVRHLNAMSHVAPRAFEVEAALVFLQSVGGDLALPPPPISEGGE